MNIAISGSTCSGKTTLISLLMERPELRGSSVITEHAEDNPYLGVADKVLQSQVFFYVEFFKDLLTAVKQGGNLIFDRTVEEHLLISEFRYKKGELSSADFAICTELASLIKEFQPKIDKTVYLYCSCDAAIERQAKRGDLSLYSKDFLESLSDAYTEYSRGLDNALFVNTDEPLNLDEILDFLLH